jgi:DNA polymerase III epsilon subunit-like protein
VTYILKNKKEPLLQETIFSVLSTFRADPRTLSTFIDVAIVRVKGEATLEKTARRLRASPPSGPKDSMRTDVSSLLDLLRESVIASYNLSRDTNSLNFILSSYGFDTLGNESISIRRLSRFLLPDLPKHDLESIADYFKIRALELERSSAAADAVADILIELLRIAAGKNIDSLRELKELMDSTYEMIDWGRYAFDRNFIQFLPPCPGVYMMKDRKGDVIYVGKALSLRERVASYFTGKEEERVSGLRDSIFDIEYEQTGTALTALLREAELIFALKPIFNKVLASPEPRKSRTKKAHTPGPGTSSPSGAGRLLLLPSVSRDEIDLVLLIAGRPLWRQSLKTDLSNLPDLLVDFHTFITSCPGPEVDLSPEEGYGVTTVESWLRRNEDLVNLIEIAGDEDEVTLERKIRLFVESGDWRGEKVVYRM